MAKEIILTQEELEENCLLESGIINAMLWHDGQLRKGTNLPYIVHPLEVMNILLQMGADKKLMIAGVLHDTAEDTEATLADIEEIFGKDVADLVASHTEMDKSLPWRERKEIALEHLVKASKREQMLVLADKLSNIEAMVRDFDKLGDELWERFNQGKEQQEWYYREALKALAPLKEDYELAYFYYRLEGAVDYLFDPQNSANYFYKQLEGVIDVSKVDSAMLNLKRMAEHGHIGAMVALAEAYQGTPAVTEDLTESFKWWKKAAGTGHPASQYNFGKCFENGKGTEVDKRQALGWYLKAAEQGFVEAMNDIGIYYAEGIVVEQDAKEAFFWFEKASIEGNYPGALYNLARCYEIGFGTEVDKEKAEELIKFADELLAKEDNERDWKVDSKKENIKEIYN